MVVGEEAVSTFCSKETCTPFST